MSGKTFLTKNTCNMQSNWSGFYKILSQYKFFIIYIILEIKNCSFYGHMVPGRNFTYVK